MELQKHWPDILEVLGNARKSNRFFSMAIVDAHGNPHYQPAEGASTDLV